MSETRRELHRVATHVLGRRRHAVTGHFGLRAGPDGIVTPAFGTEPEVLRIAGLGLVREVGGTAATVSMEGTTLAELAAFAEADLDAEFSAGDDTPSVGDAHRPLHFDADELARIVEWFDLGWRVLDPVVGGLPAPAEVATIQLWPEHFDAGTIVTLRHGKAVNLGFSPGDDFSDEPYVYLGPWGTERPGDPAFWNAPFGAARTRAEIERGDAEQASVEFLTSGLELLVEVVGST